MSDCLRLRVRVYSCLTQRPYKNRGATSTVVCVLFGTMVGAHYFSNNNQWLNGLYSDWLRVRAWIRVRA